VKAATHTEVYRRFEGRLRTHPLRFWPVFAAGVRVAKRRRLTLLLLYAVPAMATVIFSFVVYGKYAAEAQMMPGGFSGGAMVDMFARRAMRQLEVRNQIVLFNTQMQFFALLAAAWFGTGLLADDRRAGAHQLYFARPLTRLDYFLGKFATAAFFTACAVTLPGLVICLVASFASPEWSFLKQEGDVVWRTLVYSLVWVVVTSSVALCASSLAPRKAFALAGFFGFFMVLQPFSMLLGELESPRYYALSPLNDLQQVGTSIFALELTWPDLPLGLAWGVLAGVTAVSLAIVAWRLRRLEVVG
jgi:ABC-type transport system involved in multi-copper enzyme maturation permease subunit